MEYFYHRFAARTVVVAARDNINRDVVLLELVEFFCCNFECVDGRYARVEEVSRDKNEVNIFVNCLVDNVPEAVYA